MEIIFHGRHSSAEAQASLAHILCLLKERYNIQAFREMRLSVTLVDEMGIDVELVDSETNHAYRTFEIYQQGHEFIREIGRPTLSLVVDNVRSLRRSKTPI